MRGLFVALDPLDQSESYFDYPIALLLLDWQSCCCDWLAITCSIVMKGGQIKCYWSYFDLFCAEKGQKSRGGKIAVIATPAPIVLPRAFPVYKTGPYLSFSDEAAE